MMSQRRPLVLSFLAAAAFLASGCASTATNTPSVVVRPPSAAPSLPSTRLAAPQDERQERGPLGDLQRPGSDDLDVPNGQRSKGLYLSLLGAVAGYDGDLEDGGVVFNADADAEILVPATTVSNGFGVSLSNRWLFWEMLLLYQIIEFDAGFSGVPQVGNLTTEFLDLMMRRYFFVDSYIQPYLTFGIGHSESKIDNGGLLTGGGTRDAKLVNGVNYNVGGGLSMSLGPRLNVWGQIMRRFGRHDSVSGPVSGRFGITPTLDSDAWEFSSGVSIMLLRERRSFKERRR